LAIAIRNDFEGIVNFKLWLDAQTDPALVALGYTSGDIANLRSALIDLDKLGQIYRGTATQSTTYDFRSFAKFLTGIA